MKYAKLMILMPLVFMLAPSIDAQEQLPEFTPQVGFGGHSEGNGWLKLFFGKRQPFHVESHGYEQADGTFRLDQTITFQGKPPQERHWILTTSSNQYKGTLSNATGAVTGQTDGSRLKLRYRIKGPMVMHQTLDLMSDGKTIDNIGKITLLGISIGFLHETIVKKE